METEVTIIVPTLNEAENIETLVRRVLDAARAFRAEVVVVDDGSEDGTRDLVRALGEVLPVRLLARDGARDGLAGAVLAGARVGRGGVAVVIDADLSHPPERLPDLIRPVREGAYDMVIGSRYARGGSTPGWPVLRRIMSRCASALAWPLTDVQDALGGFFCVRRERLVAIPPDASGFKIALEVLVRGGDALRVLEVPIAFVDRTKGQSKMGSRVILTYFRRVLALSGWRESSDPMGLAVVRTVALWAMDAGLFMWLFASGRSWAAAAALSFAVAWVAHCALKFAQRPRGALRAGPFLARLMVLAALAFLLRHEVLACAAAWGVSPPWAIIPAIIAGWFVGFFGYALFVWPRPEDFSARTKRRLLFLAWLGYALAASAVGLMAGLAP